MNFYSSRQFSVFRIALATYILYFTFALFPDRDFLFSAHGLFQSCFSDVQSFAQQDGLVLLEDPSLLLWHFTAQIVFAILLLLGLWRPICAAALFLLLYCLENFNHYHSDFHYGYARWLLVVCMLVKPGESFSANISQRNSGWEMPKTLYWGAWGVFAFSYSVSGWYKIQNQYWTDLSAVSVFLHSAVARDSFLLSWLLLLPPIAFKAVSFVSLCGELLFPLCLFNRWSRCLFWCCLTVMHLGIASLTYLTHLALSALVFHVFLFEPSWLELPKILSKYFRRSSDLRVA